MNEELRNLFKKGIEKLFSYSNTYEGSLLVYVIQSCTQRKRRIKKVI